MKISRRKLKKEMRKLYPILPLEGKDAFLHGLPYPKATRFEVFRAQIGYIPKYVWLFSLLLVAAALLVGEYSMWDDLDFGILWSVSAVVPVLAVQLVTETFRSNTYGMAEIEMAAKYNLPQVLLIRMAAIGTADLVLVLLCTPLAAQKAGTGFWRTAIYLLVPWLCTCTLCLQVQKYRKGRETLWHSILCAGAVCIAGICAIGYWEAVYAYERFSVWIFVFLVLTIFLIKQVWCIWHEPQAWKTNVYLLE